jgi:hypothetical protein
MCAGKCKEAMAGPNARIRKVILDNDLLLKFISGETVIVEHFPIPAGARVVESWNNGSQSEYLIQHDTYDIVSCCQRAMGGRRVNYSTGG